MTQSSSCTGLLQRNYAKPDKPVRFARAIFRNSIISEAMGGCRDFWINRVIAMARGRRHDLNVDAHTIEVDGGRSWS
jgi:hypothetical protein